MMPTESIGHESEIRQTNFARRPTANDEDAHRGELWVGHSGVVLMSQSGLVVASLAQHFRLEGCKFTPADWADLVGCTRNETEIGGNAVTSRERRSSPPTTLRDVKARHCDVSAPSVKPRSKQQEPSVNTSLEDDYALGVENS